MAEDFNQNTVMLADLNRWLNAVPFAPFRIVTSSGKAYEVPSPDHLTITRLLRQIFVERDDGSGAMINVLHVSAIESAQQSK